MKSKTRLAVLIMIITSVVIIIFQFNFLKSKYRNLSKEKYIGKSLSELTLNKGNISKRISFDANNTVLFFLSNKCSICKKSLKEIKKNKFEKGINVFLIFSDSKTPISDSNMYSIDWKKNENSRFIKPLIYPTVYYVNKKGVIKKYWFGEINSKKLESICSSMEMFDSQRTEKNTVKSSNIGVQKIRLKIIEKIKVDSSINLLNPKSVLFSNDKVLFFDKGDYSIKVFDLDLRFLFKVGKKGNGPGEIRSSYCKALLTKNNYLVIAEPSQNKFLIFDNNHKFLREIKIGLADFFIEDFILTEDDAIIYTTNTSLNKVTLNGKKIFSKTIVSRRVSRVYNMYFKSINRDNNNLWVFENFNYVFYNYNFNGDLINKVTKKNFHNEGYSKSEIRKFKFRQYLSKNYKPQIANKTFLIKDYLFVLLKEREKWNYKNRIDVFDIKRNRFEFTQDSDSFSLLNNASIKNNIFISIDKSNKDYLQIVKGEIIIE